MQHKSIKIDQALHGYADGHTLLACSANLKGRDAKTMLVLSDLSGQGARIEREGYLTGYPLPESNLYAFARTWPANEMARPGCVWTHTLLIDFTDLAALRSLGTLKQAFRRPTAGAAGYEKPITVEGEENSSLKIGGDVATISITLRRLLWALYGSPKCPVIASRTTDLDLDALVLAIWAQQWPRLRRSFRFCTLAASDRSSDGAIFDLQLLQEQGRLGRSSFPEAVDADQASLPKDSDWLDHTANDLISPSDLRVFLRRAGGDVTSGREAFVPLCRLHRLVHDFSARPAAVEGAIALLESEFPADQSRVARMIVVNEAADRIEGLGNSTLDFVLRHLDLVDLHVSPERVENIGEALWSRDPRTFTQLMTSGEIARYVAEHTLRTIPTNRLIQGLRKAIDLEPAVITLRPEVLMEPSFWTLDGVARSEWYNAVAESPQQRGAILLAMFLSRQPELANLASERFEPDLLLAVVISAVDHKGNERQDEYERTWLKAAVSDADAVARVLSSATIRTLATLVAVARLTSPNYVPNYLGQDPWLRAAQVADGKLSESNRYYLSAYWLARALGKRSRNADELMALSFDDVYNAAKRSRLPDEAWRLVEPRLPKSLLWLEWDRCRRLSDAVVEAFIDRGLAPVVFGRITSDEELFAILSSTAARTSRGRTYLRRVQRTLEEDSERYSRRIQVIEKLLH